MAKPEYSQIPPGNLVELCSRGFYTLDGLWFSLVEKKFGIEAALEIDEEVWRRLYLAQAKRLLKYVPVDEDSPIRRINRLIELDPLLAVYKVETAELTDNRTVIRCTNCPPQKARIRDGRGEFPCKPVGIALFKSLASVIDPDINLTCLTCPPDAHPKQFWCEWQFEI